jgi:cytochrome c-type biogenesis protein CcmH
VKPAWIVTALLVALAGCERSERPVPLAPLGVATPTPSANAIRPLTSRDGAAPEAAPGAPAEGLPPGHPPVGGAPSASTAGAVTGTIAVAPSLAGRVGTSDVLFLVARSASTRQVLAVRKEEAARFPFAFEISGMDAMVEGTSFEGPLDITARISKSGDAIPAKGDIEGFARGVATGAKGVSITLDSVRQ